MCGTVDTMKKIIAGSFSNMKKIITNKICYRTVNTIYFLKKKKKGKKKGKCSILGLGKGRLQSICKSCASSSKVYIHN